MILNPIYKGGGIQLPTLSNPATAADMRNGKQLIDQNGQPLTGTMPNVTVSTPSISVNGNGLITASGNVSGNGYVTSGAKTKTLQLSSAHDPQFIAANIKQGVNIFGVTGTYQGGKPSYIDADENDVPDLLYIQRDGDYFELTVTVNIKTLYGFSVWVRSRDAELEIFAAYPSYSYNDSHSGQINAIVGFSDTLGRSSNIYDALVEANGNTIRVSTSSGVFGSVLTDLDGYSDIDITLGMYYEPA